MYVHVCVYYTCLYVYLLFGQGFISCWLKDCKVIKKAFYFGFLMNEIFPLVFCLIRIIKDQQYCSKNIIEINKTTILNLL